MKNNQLIIEEFDQQKNRTNYENNKSFTQFSATLSATLGGFLMGTVIGWTGPALPKLINEGGSTLEANGSAFENNDFPVTVNDGNFIASLFPAGALIGGLLSINHP